VLDKILKGDRMNEWIPDGRDRFNRKDADHGGKEGRFKQKAKMRKRFEFNPCGQTPGQREDTVVKKEVPACEGANLLGGKAAERGGEKGVTSTRKKVPT